MVLQEAAPLPPGTRLLPRHPRHQLAPYPGGVPLHRAPFLRLYSSDRDRPYLPRSLPCEEVPRPPLEAGKAICPQEHGYGEPALLCRWLDPLRQSPLPYSPVKLRDRPSRATAPKYALRMVWAPARKRREIQALRLGESQRRPLPVTIPRPDS